MRIRSVSSPTVWQVTGKPRFFLQLLVDNLNENDNGWSVGTCIDAAEKTLSFSHEYCMDVLNRFADEWETEFEFAGKTVNFGKVEYFKDSPLALSYGRGNGFKTGVGRQVQGDKAPVSILYVQGGERNIDPTAYGSQTLLLPKSQELEYEGRRYKTDKDGMYITRADRELPNHNEDSYDASHIYPSRVGTVSEVIAVDAENHLYDIKDNTIPDNLDYGQCRIPGEKATLIFQSGVLTGEEFDIEQTDDDLTGYDHAERRFQLVPVEKEGGIIPNENRKPAVGDTYAVFNISLPEAYICDDESQTGASWEMFREAVRYLYENEEERFTFKGELDGIWSKSRWLEVGGYMRPGAYIFFSDTQFQPDGVRIRVTGVKDFINRPYSPELELSNTPVAGFVSSELGKIDSNEVKDEERYRGALHYTKRRWRDALEAQEMLEKAFDNYSKGIDPIWVRTMSLLVGDESLQFRFVNNKTNPQPVEPDFIYNEETQVFTAPAAILQHMTLGISDIKGTHAATEYKYWDMSAYTSPPLGDFGYLYLYARCSKSGTTGQFLLSETAHKMEEGSDYYFLIGLLGSQYDGTRSFVTVYGFTEILPGRITVDRIVSTDGQCYFNLGIGEIGGKITFKSGTTGYYNITDRPSFSDLYQDVDDALQAAEDASNAANQAQNTADDKAKVFYSTTAPRSGMRTNDLWVDGVNIYRYNGSTWVFVSEYDCTETVINQGLITTGAIAFGSTGGMAGSGSIRIWSGGNSGANGQPPSSPTFSVDSSGNVNSRGSIYITNPNGQKLAGFSGSGTAGSSVRIWAGNATPDSAPFRVTQEGKVYASNCELTGGTIGGFTIGAIRLTNNNGNAGIDIDYSGDKFVHINTSGGNLMLAARNDYGTAATFESYGNGGIALRLTGQGTSKAIDSVGAMTIKLRTNETFWLDTGYSGYGVFRISGLPGRTSTGLRFSGEVRIHQSDGVNFLVLA